MRKCKVFSHVCLSVQGWYPYKAPALGSLSIQGPLPPSGHIQTCFGPHCTRSPSPPPALMSERVHYVACAPVHKRAIGIRLKCLLVFDGIGLSLNGTKVNVTAKTTYHVT